MFRLFEQKIDWGNFKMMRLTGLILFVACINALLQPTATYASVLKSIYGNDDRQDIFKLTNPGHKLLASSVAAIVQKSNLIINSSQNSPQSFSVPQTSAQEIFGLCPSEPYATRPAPGTCTAFLIAPKLMLTAGHCVTGHYHSCKSTSFVFGFKMQGPLTPLTTFDQDDVYFCKRIIEYMDTTAPDWALVELDRKVSNRVPLKLAAGDITKDEEVFMIGHPSGLPMMMTSNAKVRSTRGLSFFVTNLDSWGGNSGSPVFNKQTQEVEGILVRGDLSFVPHGDCLVSKTCQEDECRGSDVTSNSSFMYSWNRPLINIENITLSDQTQNANGNGSFEPGELINLKFMLDNIGFKSAKDIVLTLKSDNPNITFTNKQLPLGQIDALSSKVYEQDLNLLIASELACGTHVKLTLEIKYLDTYDARTKEVTKEFSFYLGKKVTRMIQQSQDLNLEIPDEDTTGLLSKIEVNSSQQVNGVATVSLELAHSAFFDLKISIHAPNGKSAVLHNQVNVENDFIKGTFGDDLVPFEDLANLDISNYQGTWTLSVVDSEEDDIGKLISWGIGELKYTCE
ncbi:MAG: trypsin-like peptidase domain-containing protein [Bacteriovoracaceae bacterium]|nr:trypsin-like peptidase domain-containing protein [Bacteriovoracaceae bacterium]